MKSEFDKTAHIAGVKISNSQRDVYPEVKITKQELAEYYAAVAQWILPHIAGRPIALVRAPSGVNGPKFFQKHPPAGLSKAVRRVQIREKDEEDTYLVVDDLTGLVSLIQFGALELHLWGARFDTIERPDRMIFDLDPDEAVPWKEVVHAANLVREILAEVDLQSWLKTTGGKGFHVVVPLARRYTWEQVKSFARGLAEWLERHDPARFIAKMSKVARRGKIFVDYLRNERGSTAIAPYSTRAKPHGTIAMPIAWDELPALRGAGAFHLKNFTRHLQIRKADPWKNLAAAKQTISREAFRHFGGS